VTISPSGFAGEAVSVRSSSRDDRSPQPVDPGDEQHRLDLRAQRQRVADAEEWSSVDQDHIGPAGELGEDLVEDVRAEELARVGRQRARAEHLERAGDRDGAVPRGVGPAPERPARAVGERVRSERVADGDVSERDVVSPGLRPSGKNLC